MFQGTCIREETRIMLSALRLARTYLGDESDSVRLIRDRARRLLDLRNTNRRVMRRSRK